MRASHKDSPSMQKSKMIDGWLALVDVQDSADFHDSCFLLMVNVILFVLMVVTTLGWTGDPLVTIAAALPFLVPLLVDPSV